MSFYDDMLGLNAPQKPRAKFVVESHRLHCSHCGRLEYGLGFWFDVAWVSGANPPGPPALFLCRPCLELADVGPLVG